MQNTPPPTEVEYSLTGLHRLEFRMKDRAMFEFISLLSREVDRERALFMRRVDDDDS